MVSTRSNKSNHSLCRIFLLNLRQQIRIQRNQQQEAGGIVLEAAITLPFFLTFVLALITVVQIVSTEMSLQVAVSETVKQTAHHYAPVHMLSGAAAEEVDELLQSKGVPAFARSWLADVASDILDVYAWPHIFTSVLQGTSSSIILTPERLAIVSVSLPAIDQRNVFVEMVAEYRIPIVLPFYHREFVLRKKAAERAWIGGK